MSWFVPVDNVAMMSTLCRWACVHVLRFVSAKCVTACTSYLAAFSLTLSLLVTIGLIADHLAACMLRWCLPVSMGLCACVAFCQCEMCHCVYFLPCCIFPHAVIGSHDRPHCWSPRCLHVCLCRWVCVHVLHFISAHSQLHSQAHSQPHSQAHSQLHSRAHSQLHNQAHSQLHSQAQCEMCHCVYFLPCCVSLTPNLLWFPGQVDVSWKSFLFVIIVQLGSLAKKGNPENLAFLCKSGWLPHGCHARHWQDSHDATCPNGSHF